MLGFVALATLAMLAVATASGTCTDVSYKVPTGMCKDTTFKFRACVPDDKTSFQAQMDKLSSDYAGSHLSINGPATCKTVDAHSQCATVGKTPRTDYCSTGGGYCDMMIAHTFATLHCDREDDTCTPRTDVSIVHKHLMCCNSNEAVIRSMCGTPATEMNYTAGVDKLKTMFVCAETDCYSVPPAVGEGDSTIITAAASTSSAARVISALGALAVPVGLAALSLC